MSNSSPDVPVWPVLRNDPTGHFSDPCECLSGDVNTGWSMISATVRHLINLFFMGLGLGAFSLVAFAANVINMAVFLRQGLRQSPSNISFFFLSFGDLGTSAGLFVACTCFCLAEVRPGSDIDFISVGIIWGTANRQIFADISVIVTIFISAHRSLCVVAPFRFKEILTPRMTLVIIALIYAFVFSCYAPGIATQGLSWQFDIHYNRTRYLLHLEGDRYTIELLNKLLNSIILTTVAQIVVMVSACVLVLGLKKSSRFRNTARWGSADVRERINNGWWAYTMYRLKQVFGKKKRARGASAFTETSSSSKNILELNKCHHQGPASKLPASSVVPGLKREETHAAISGNVSPNHRYIPGYGKRNRLIINTSTNTESLVKSNVANIGMKPAKEGPQSKSPSMQIQTPCADLIARDEKTCAEGKPELSVHCIDFPLTPTTKAGINDMNTSVQTLVSEGTNEFVTLPSANTHIEYAPTCPTFAISADVAVPKLAKAVPLQNVPENTATSRSSAEIFSCQESTEMLPTMAAETLVSIRPICSVSPQLPPVIELPGSRENVVVTTHETSSLCCHTKPGTAAGRSTQSLIPVRREQNAIKMVLLISACFVICNVPYVTTVYAQVFVENFNFGRQYGNLHFLMFCLICFTYNVNGTANTFIYYSLSTRFRQTFRQLFCLS